MRVQNERPVCHRAEDLVTYLYGEASQSEALDFREHLQQCAACSSEFGIFNQVHESIQVWRNEALGTARDASATAAAPSFDSTQFVRHERKLSAVGAIREFFSVSPLWLRGATAFAGLLLCVLVVLTIARSWPRPVEVANGRDDPKAAKAKFDNEVAKEVERQLKANQASAPQPKEVRAPVTPAVKNEIARVRTPAKPRVRGLSLEERVQLAADLRLIPSDDEEQSLGLTDQPDQ